MSRHKKETRKQRRAREERGRRRQAARNPNWVNHFAASKWTLEDELKFRNRKLGKCGAASPVRILMKDGQPLPEPPTQPSGTENE